MQFLITGISGGIGKALVEVVLANGDQCIGLTRDAQKIEKRITSHPNMQLVELDWSDDNDWRTKIDQLPKGGIEILINNAATMLVKPLMETTEEEFVEVFRVNSVLPTMLTSYLYKRSKFSDGAHVVNISSMAGFQGSSKFSGLGAYSASKAALANLTEMMAAEWKGISVNCLCLGAVNTEMLAEAFPGYISPVDPENMASFIHSFGITGRGILGGRVISVALTDPER